MQGTRYRVKQPARHGAMPVAKQGAKQGAKRGAVLGATYGAHRGAGFFFLIVFLFLGFTVVFHNPFSFSVIPLL